MNRARDWRVVYVSRKGEQMATTHSSRELARDRMVSELMLSAVLMWLSPSPVDHQRGDHALRLALAVEKTTEGSYAAVTHAGGKWLLVEV